MKLLSSVLISSGVSAFFMRPQRQPQQAACRDLAGNCQKDAAFCSDENVAFTYKWCQVTCGTCGKQPVPVQQQMQPMPQSCADVATNCEQEARYCGDEFVRFSYHACPRTCNTCGKKAPGGLTMQQPMQQNRNSPYGSMFNNMKIPSNDGRDFYSGRTDATKSTYKPFVGKPSDIANSWGELHAQNKEAARSIAHWNSKSTFDWNRYKQEDEKRLRARQRYGYGHRYGNQGYGNQGDDAYGESFNPFSSILGRAPVAQAPQSQPQPVAPVQQQLPVAPVQQPSYARQVAVPKPVSPPVTPYNPNVLKTEISVDKTVCKDDVINCASIDHLCESDELVRTEYCRKSCNECADGEEIPAHLQPKVLQNAEVQNAIAPAPTPATYKYQPQVQKPDVEAPVKIPVEPEVNVEPVQKECIDSDTKCSFITEEMCAQPFMTEMRKKCPKTCNSCNGEQPASARLASIPVSLEIPKKKCIDSIDSNICTTLATQTTNKEMLMKFCERKSIWASCPLTCNKCAEFQELPSCMDTIDTCETGNISKDKLCAHDTLKLACKKTCNICAAPKPVTTQAPTTTLEPKPVITRPNLDDMFLRQIEMIRSKNDPSEGPPGVELERVGGPVGVVVQKEELSVEEAYSGLSYNSNPVLPKETVTNSVDPSNSEQAPVAISNQAHATYSGQANPVLPSNTAHESANESAPIAQAAPVAQLAPAPIAPVSWLQTEPSEPSTVFEVDNVSACRDNYPEFCKLKAGGNCHKQTVWERCGATCNRCSETKDIEYECKDMNDLCQTDMMILNCKSTKWVRESCPISCNSVPEFCPLSATASPETETVTEKFVPDFVAKKDMSPNCAGPWSKLCHIEIFAKACPVSCPK